MKPILLHHLSSKEEKKQKWWKQWPVFPAAHTTTTLPLPGLSLQLHRISSRKDSRGLSYVVEPTPPWQPATLTDSWAEQEEESQPTVHACTVQLQDGKGELKLQFGGYSSTTTNNNTANPKTINNSEPVYLISFKATQMNHAAVLYLGNLVQIPKLCWKRQCNAALQWQKRECVCVCVCDRETDRHTWERRRRKGKGEEREESVTGKVAADSWQWQGIKLIIIKQAPLSPGLLVWVHQYIIWAACLCSWTHFVMVFDMFIPSAGISQMRVSARARLAGWKFNPRGKSVCLTERKEEGEEDMQWGVMPPWVLQFLQLRSYFGVGPLIDRSKAAWLLMWLEECS